MDEIGRETAAGHRPSVSMPSLDSTDDFGGNSESRDAVFESNDSFVAPEIATATEASNDGVSVVSGGISVTPTTTAADDVPFAAEELSSESLIGGEGQNQSENAFIQPPNETSSSESQPADLQQECLDESQGEEDPSIAIDQFIKKIADEQLSSKRIEERKEEEALEQIDTNLEGSVKKDENRQVESEESAAIVEEKENPDSQEVKAKDEEMPKPEPMEVDKEVKDKPSNEGGTEEVLNEDEHMAESIEEIQKEINKIPPKKVEKEEEIDKVQTEQPAIKNGEESTDEKPESPKKDDLLKTALEKDRKVFNIQDSAEVCKDPILIEKSQEALKKLDVLVCGECHNTFYFIQELTEHKNKCPKKSALMGTCEAENKPQVWGFTLWKTKQIKDQTGSVPSAWAMYQKWCKLPQGDRSAWITAGQSIQFVSKLTNAKVTEVRSVKSAKQTTVQKITGASPPPLEFIDSNKENSSSMEVESSGNYMNKGFTKPVKLNNDVTIIPSVKKDEFVVEKIMAKRFNPRKKTWEYNIKWENFGHDSNTWEPIGNLSHCKVLLEQFEEQLKRMKEEKAKQSTGTPKGRGRPANPKPSTKPVTSYVSIAPKSVMSLSANEDYSAGGRPQRSSKQKAMDQVKQWCGSISDDDGSDGLKRKRDTDDSDDDFDDKKIKLEEDSDYSDKDVKSRMSFRKIQSTPKSVQKVTHQVKNGSTSQQILPSNILIPDANGVVRINQKQLPALSSGVYIMSKTAGIIKLDSTTSKVATSGGQTVVKVAPKIGQTQIKIVKKDGNTTKQIIQVSPQSSSLSATPVRISQTNRSNILQKGTAQKVRKEVKKSPVEAGSKSAGKKNEDSMTSDNQESDSDDGLEPLPFPTEDEPIPDVNEEKADEFILDPTTGKLAGVEYVDKPVVVNDSKPPPASTVLENIVKLAVSEEEDLQGAESQAVPVTIIEKKDPKQQQQPQTVIKADQKTVEMSTGGGVRKIVKYSVAGANVHGQTTKSVVGTPVTRIVGTPGQPQRRVVHQKVINQMVSQKVSAQPTRTVVRHVIEPARPGQGGGNLNVVRKTVTTPARPKFNLSPQKPARTYSAMGGIRQGSTGGGNKVHVYSAMSSNVPTNQTASMVQAGARKVGNTVVRSVAQGAHVGTPRPQIVQRQAVQQQHPQQKGPVTRVVQRVVQQGPRKVPVTQQHQVAKQPAANKPKTVISMPSLTEDDTVPSPVKTQTRTPTSGQKVAEQQQQKAVAAPKEESVASKSEAAAQMDESATLDQTDWSSFTMADGENPIYVTGDDGTLYQVAGQNEQGQTILITQGPDGQQQCLLVTSEIGEVNSEEQQPSTSAANVTATETNVTVAGDNIAAVQTQEATPTTSATAIDKNLQTPLQIKTDVSEMEGIEEGVQDQVVAQVVRTEPPSPGGTHKVVVMLPDGNLMVTQVSKEEYASLELE